MPLPSVLAVGLLTLDVVQTISAIPSENEKITASDLLLDYGGPAANAAGVAVGLGGTARLASVAGESHQARIAAALLARSGVELVDCAPGAAEGFPVSSVLVQESTGARAVISTNAQKTTPTFDLDPSLVHEAGACLIDGHHLPLCQQAAREAKRCKVPVVFDGGSWKPGTMELLADVDVALISADFRVPENLLDGQDQLSWLANQGPCVVAQSHGEQPIEVLIDGQRRLVPVPQAPIVDSVGAGDVLHGALAWALAARGFTCESVPAALEFAALVASISVQARGAREWLKIPSLSQRADYLAEQFAVHGVAPGMPRAQGRGNDRGKPYGGTIQSG